MTVGLWVESPLEGPNLTLEIEPTDAFNLYFPEIDTLETIYHQSLHRLVHTRMTNDSDQDIFLPAGTPFGEACLMHSSPEILVVFELEPWQRHFPDRVYFFRPPLRLV
jgi:hypothetical protein